MAVGALAAPGGFIGSEISLDLIRTPDESDVLRKIRLAPQTGALLGNLDLRPAGLTQRQWWCSLAHADMSGRLIN